MNPPQAPPFELFSWGAAWGLSSFDPFCMSMQCYLSLACAPWISTVSSTPKISPSGELPLLRDATIPIAGTHAIIRHLKRKGYDLDIGLSPVQLAQSAAFINLIETKLHDALLHTLFVDAKNYNQNTLQVYSKQLDILRRFYVPEVLKKRVIARLAGYRMMLNDKKDLVNEVYLNAKDIFQALSDKLGDQLYFFGNRPTTLDAIAYAHLSLHALPLLTNPTLSLLLTVSFPSLSSYISRMQATIESFPGPTDPPTSQFPALHILNVFTNPQRAMTALFDRMFSTPSPTAITTTATSATADDPTRDEKTRSERVDAFYKWSSVAGAVLFFVGYVVKNGIVQIDSLGDGEADAGGDVIEAGGDQVAGDDEDGYSGEYEVIVDEDGNLYEVDKDEE